MRRCILSLSVTRTAFRLDCSCLKAPLHASLDLKWPHFFPPRPRLTGLSYLMFMVADVNGFYDI